MQQKAADKLNIYYCSPHLVYSECYTARNREVDTDIQHCYDSLSVPLEQRINTELEFYGLDNVYIVGSVQEMYSLVQLETTTGILVYRSDNTRFILSLEENCIHPCYTIGDHAIIVVTNPTDYHLKHRYFNRLMKNNKFNISDAIRYID